MSIVIGFIELFRENAASDGFHEGSCGNIKFVCSADVLDAGHHSHG